MLSLIFLVMADPLDMLTPLTDPGQQKQFAASTVAELRKLTTEAADATARADAIQRQCLAEPVRYLSLLPALAARSQSDLNGYLAAQDTVHADLELRRLAVALGKGEALGAQVQSCMSGGLGTGVSVSSTSHPQFPGLTPVSFLEHEDVLIPMWWAVEPCGSCF